VNSSPRLHAGRPVSCLPSLSCTFLHSARGKGAGDWKCGKSPDSMLPDSLLSAQHKLSSAGDSGSNSARLCSAQQTAEFAANAKLKSIFVPLTYLPDSLYVFLPSASFPKLLFSKGSSVLLLAMHPERWLSCCYPAFSLWAFVFTFLIKGRLSLILVSKIVSSYCPCFCFLK